MATAFETALSGAQTSVSGLVDDALPFVAGIAALFIAPKLVKRFIRGV